VLREPKVLVVDVKPSQWEESERPFLTPAFFSVFFVVEGVFFPWFTFTFIGFEWFFFFVVSFSFCVGVGVFFSLGLFFWGFVFVVGGVFVVFVFWFFFFFQVSTTSVCGIQSLDGFLVRPCPNEGSDSNKVDSLVFSSSAIWSLAQEGFKRVAEPTSFSYVGLTAFRCRQGPHFLVHFS